MSFLVTFSFHCALKKGLDGSKLGVFWDRKGGESDPLIKRGILLYLHCILLMRLDRGDLRGQGQWGLLLSESLPLTLNPVLIGTLGGKLIILALP